MLQIITIDDIKRMALCPYYIHVHNKTLKVIKHQAKIMLANFRSKNNSVLEPLTQPIPPCITWGLCQKGASHSFLQT